MELAREAGIDLEQFRRPGEKYNTERLRELLVAANLNVEAYETETLTFRLPMVKKGPVAERMIQVTEKAADLVEKMVPKLRTAIEQSAVDVSATDVAVQAIAKAKSRTSAPSM